MTSKVAIFAATMLTMTSSTFAQIGSTPACDVGGEPQPITGGIPSPARCEPLSGVMKTSVIVVKTANTPSSCSVGVDAVRRVFFETDASVRAFYQETSYRKFDVQGDVFGPVTINQRNLCLSRPPDLEKLRV